MSRVLGLVLLLVPVSIAGRATAGEEYYMLMFGSQRIPPNPNYSHTFATFVKVSWPGDGPCPTDPVLEAHTISWLPANLRIRTSALLPERGHNFDLHPTLDNVYSTEQRVSLWGPYRIEQGFYYRALARKAELESGSVLYQANDIGRRTDRVTNCIHAVGTIMQGPRLRVASPGWGQSASFYVLQAMRSQILSREPVAWVGSALDLDKYPIIYRDFRNPRSAAIVGGLFRALGGERNVQATYGPPAR